MNVSRASIAAIVVALLAIAAIGAAVWRLESATRGVTITRGMVGTVPITVFRPDRRDAAAPPVVVAHGFAGSQPLMHPLAVTLARNGYVAVTFDFPGHGRSPVPMPGGFDDDDARQTRAAGRARCGRGARARRVLDRRTLCGARPLDGLGLHRAPCAGARCGAGDGRGVGLRTDDPCRYAAGPAAQPARRRRRPGTAGAEGRGAAHDRAGGCERGACRRDFGTIRRRHGAARGVRRRRRAHRRAVCRRHAGRIGRVARRRVRTPRRRRAVPRHARSLARPAARGRRRAGVAAVAAAAARRPSRTSGDHAPRLLDRGDRARRSPCRCCCVRCRRASCRCCSPTISSCTSASTGC